jgi:hypothetical protein
MLGCHMKNSRGGVKHVGVPREGFTWWCHLVELSGGVTGWWCHMKESLGGVTHVGVSREGYMWWSHGVVSHM